MGPHCLAMAVITANGYSYDQSGGVSIWPPSEYRLLSVTFLDATPDLPPYPVRPPWRRAIRTISAT